MSEEKIHAATAMDIYERLKNIIETLNSKITPEELEKAISELRSLAEDVKVKYAKKPIPKKAWENVWSGVIGDFIMAFEHNAVNPDVKEVDEPQDWFLRGMAKGMWTIYNMIEELMVELQ